MVDTADKANEIEGQSTEREISRIEAAVEGAEDMRAWTGRGEDPNAEINTTGGGARAVGGDPGGSRGAGLTSAGPGDQDPSPAAETGGPRGAGTGVSRTSGGIDPETGREIDPEQRIKEETSFRPKKPLPKAEDQS